VIGDLHSAALVASDGTIDWCCLPRFDSPSIFGSLLDARRGGQWRIQPTDAWTSEQRYLPATNVLVTEFRLARGGVVHLTDFMPVGPARSGSEIHRRVACIRSGGEVELELVAAFDYGREPASLLGRAFGVLLAGRRREAAALSGPAGTPWRFEDGAIRARLALGEGEDAWFVFRFDEDEVHPVGDYRSVESLEATTRWWDAWVSPLAYQGPYRREVERSALALKLCSYQPSGAIVGAPTTSLPESPGGDRNWDYRYTWLRDSAFVLFALDRLGFGAEVDAFQRFLKRVCRGAPGEFLQVMFAVDGSRDLPETVLDHLDGYRGSRPVRIGNSAAGQFQLDIYGELLETFAIAHRRRPLSEGGWEALRGLVEAAAAQWRRPDYSIWEARREPRHYVYSKVMAWAALDRGIRLARRHGLSADLERWERERDAVHAEVMEKGWNPGLGSFVQCYDDSALDAAVLIIPKIGFLPRSDPRVRSTLDAVVRRLGTSCEELIYRYRSPDGLRGDEGAFLPCSFWRVQVLAMIGEHAEAERLFRNLLRRANHLGLLAEEMDPATGEQLGNFPQALSHAALINTACILERLRPVEPASQPAATAASAR
jgi:GH15 family glucan-1,4-alpha-glucosidase